MTEPVYLTFDDGPDRNWTPQILDLLAETDMRATFFVIASRAQLEPDLVRRILDEGHMIGNHSYSHRHPWFMTARTARAEVRDGATALEDMLGYAPRLFRPPHGRHRECMTDEARRQGEHIVLWNVSAIDWGIFGTAQRIGRRLRQTSANDVVLMHDGRNRHNRPDQLLEALPTFLLELQRRDLRSVGLPIH
jgi:peptidoglycan/xylan/chitin deacetylase (PgdA/CDA1 family)